MILIIAEKKELGEAIANVIPGQKKVDKLTISVGNYIICWLYGHILKLKEPNEIDKKYEKWKIEDLPIYFDLWKKKVIKDKEYLFKNVEKLLKRKELEYIIHAGDPDDEGQYLVDEVLEFLNNKKPVKRLLINDNSNAAVRKSFNNLEDNKKYINLGKAAHGRAVSDFLLGANLSRYYSLNNKGLKLTVGRVQTPTLALVVRRDLEIENHIKEKYYELFFKDKINGIDLNLKYNSNEKENVLNRDIFDNLINLANGKKVEIKVTKTSSYNSPPLPYNLAKLLSEAGRKFKYDVDKILQITQNLRDKHKAITYNRSDCHYLSEEHWKEAPKLVPVIMNKLGLNFKTSFDKDDRSKCFDDSKITAHHGIIPTFEGNINNFTTEEKNIYTLISHRYLIQFMNKEKVEKTEAVIEVNNNKFKATSTLVLEKGYTILEKVDREEEDKNNLYNLSEGVYNVFLSKDKFYILEKETKPKKPYTQSSLIEDMNNIAKYVKDERIKKILKDKDKDKDQINGSIGTSATQAPIIKGLLDKKYLEKKGNNIVSTHLAREYLKILPDEVKVPDMTALWWLIQERIKAGKENMETLPLSVLDSINDILARPVVKIPDEVKKLFLNYSQNNRDKKKNTRKEVKNKIHRKGL